MKKERSGSPQKNGIRKHGSRYPSSENPASRQREGLPRDGSQPAPGRDARKSAPAGRDGRTFAPREAKESGRSTDRDKPPVQSERPSPLVQGHPWYQSVFAPHDAFVRTGLEYLPRALDTVMPLSAKHRVDLPESIRELSERLTSDRSEIARYWTAPRLVSAYLRYFLPWNLIRLTRLLPALHLPIPGAAVGSERTVVDLGSGPLTLPIALWLSRPDWRATPLTLLCVDTVPHPMEAGRRLLETLAEQTGEPLRWEIRLLRTSFMRAFREIRQPHLILAGNVLNELRDGEGVRDRMSELALALDRTLSPEGSAVFVEPGTRLGGSLIASLREAALEETALFPAAPCPHCETCPLPGRRDRGWCHVTLDALAPRWLASTSRDARLNKDSLSLSFLQLGTRSAGAHLPGNEKGIDARVLSEAFPVPGMGRARYACTKEGLAIIPAAEGIPSGALVACRHPAIPRRDAKSGAAELLWQVDPTFVGKKV